MSQRPEDRPPYVKFSIRAVEDRSKSIGGGKYGYKDVHMAHITVIGQKDTVDREVTEWLLDVAKKAEDGRIPPEWPERFQKQYQFWLSGQEMPLTGTPIRGWNILAPSMQETLLLLGIMTVEDLANITDEASGRIGIGGQALRHKAKAWLAASEDKGKVAEENAALKVRQDELQAQLNQQAEVIQQLKALLPKEAPKNVADANF